MTAFVSRAMMASGSKPGEGPYGERLVEEPRLSARPRAGKRADQFQGRERAGAHVRPRLRPDVPGRVPEGRAQGRYQREDRTGGKAHRQVAEQGRRLALSSQARRRRSFRDGHATPGPGRRPRRRGRRAQGSRSIGRSTTSRRARTATAVSATCCKAARAVLPAPRRP